MFIFFLLKSTINCPSSTKSQLEIYFHLFLRLSECVCARVFLIKNKTIVNSELLLDSERDLCFIRKRKETIKIEI